MTDPITPWQGGPKNLDKHNNHIMPSPRVIAIYWGDDYTSQLGSSRATLGQKLDDYFNAIFPSPYFDLLQEYGVNSRPAFLGSVRLPYNRGQKKLDTQGVADTLKKWLDTGLLSLPDKHETNLFYMIFMPSQITLDIGQATSGFHSSAGYNNDLFSDANLFFAAIGFDAFEMLTWAACHEMVEAFTDRDGNGWQDGDMTREIGDFCQGPGIIYFDGSRVASFWSASRGNCIQQHDLPPNNPVVTATPNPNPFGFDTPTTFYVEAKDPVGGQVTGTATISEILGRHSHPVGQPFSVPGSSMPITRKGAHSSGGHGIALPPEYALTFTPDDADQWNKVSIAL